MLTLTHCLSLKTSYTHAQPSTHPHSQLHWTESGKKIISTLSFNYLNVFPFFIIMIWNVRFQSKHRLWRFCLLFFHSFRLSVIFHSYLSFSASAPFLSCCLSLSLSCSYFSSYILYFCLSFFLLSQCLSLFPSFNLSHVHILSLFSSISISLMFIFLSLYRSLSLFLSLSFYPFPPFSISLMFIIPFISLSFSS